MAAFDDIVDGVLEEGGFPASDRSLAEGWVNEVHRRAVADAEWLKRKLTIAVTVVGQADYDVPAGVVDIVGIYLADADGKPGDWQRVSETAMWDIQAGRVQVAGSGGVFAPAYGPNDEKRITLYPAPDTAGQSIVALAAMSPVAMVAGATPVVPEDMHGDLKDGAIALGLLRMDERSDSAAVFDARFERMVAKLRRRRISRIGSRTSRVRVFGHDFRG